MVLLSIFFIEHWKLNRQSEGLSYNIQKFGQHLPEMDGHNPVLIVASCAL